MTTQAHIRALRPEECTGRLLAGFDRFQQVRRCWRRENQAWVLKDIAFEENWGPAQKAEIARGMAACAAEGGAALGAFLADRLAGFACVPARLFGPGQEYIQLKELHVSCESRGTGVGRALFLQACAGARLLGGRALYISAHSSQETQAFYRRMGCVDAREIDPGLYAAEPYDRHLELTL